MASFDRIDRISQECHKAIDGIIRDELNDPRIGGTWSIVRCEVTRDLRYVPEVQFELDTNIEYAAHINQLLKETQRHDETSDD